MRWGWKEIERVWERGRWYMVLLMDSIVYAIADIDNGIVNYHYF